MNPNDKTGIRESAYLFNVDLLVEGESNAQAMERLLHALNRCGFADFRIKSGVELGKLIEELESSSIEPVKQAQPSPDTLHEAVGINTLIKENKLIRLTVNKGFGVKMNIPCRIITYDEPGQMLTVYHVDEKQVYTFKLNEIDDFTV